MQYVHRDVHAKWASVPHAITFYKNVYDIAYPAALAYKDWNVWLSPFKNKPKYAQNSLI